MKFKRRADYTFADGLWLGFMLGMIVGAVIIVTG